MNNVDTQIEVLAQCIKDSEIYCQYRIQVEKVKKQPGLLEKINEFRQRNYDLQNSPAGIDMLDAVEAFGREYEKFRENPLVEDFLQSELAVCRLMQEIQVKLTEAIDFV